MTDRMEVSCPGQFPRRQKGAYGERGALSETEKQTALREVLDDPSENEGEREEDIQDPNEGRDEVPPSIEELIDWLRSIERRYGSVSWSWRRYWIAGWLQDINNGYGPFRCLDDLSEALFSVDDKDGRVHPMLQPDFRPGRPPLTRTEFNNRCLIALAIDAMKADGWSIERSAKTIAGQLSNHRAKYVHIRTIRYSSGSVPSWETIRNWREEIARIARGREQHPTIIRETAAKYLRQRDRLRQVMAARKIHPQDLAALLLQQMRPVPGLRKIDTPLLLNSR